MTTLLSSPARAQDPGSTTAGSPGRSASPATLGERLAWGAALAVILVSALAVRLHYLSRPMRFDESYSFLHYAVRPLSQIISAYDTTNNHILNSLLMHLAAALWGESPEVLRLPSLACGVLLVVAVHSATRRLYDRYAALFAAAVAASASIMIEYSVNARGYSFLALLFLVLMRLAPDLKDNPRPAAWIGFGALAALGFYAVPVMLYPYAMVAIWLFLSILVRDTPLPRVKAMGLLVLSGLVTALSSLLLYLPVLLHQPFNDMEGLNPDVIPKSVGLILRALPQTVAKLSMLWIRDMPMILGVVLGVFAVLSLILHRRVAAHRIPFHAAALLGIGGILFVHRVVPYPRVLLFLFPLFVVLASATFTGLMAPVRDSRLKRLGFPVFAATYAVLACLLVVKEGAVDASLETGVLPEADAVARVIEGAIRPGDRLVMAQPSDEIVKYYFRRHGFPYEQYAAQEQPDSRRVLVLVNLVHGERIMQVLLGNGVRLAPSRIEALMHTHSVIVVEFESM